MLFNMFIQGGLMPLKCIKIQKYLNFIREGGGQHFSQTSEIQKKPELSPGGGGGRPTFFNASPFPSCSVY